MIKGQQEMIMQLNKKIDKIELKTNQMEDEICSVDHKIEQELSNVHTKMELSNVMTLIEGELSNVPTKMELSNVTTKMEEEFSNIDQKTTQMAEGLAFLHDPPIYMGCAYQNNVYAVNSRVPFDSIYYERSDSWTESGGLDLSGTFTCGYSGSYSVTWSLRSADTAGESMVDIY